MSAILLEGRPIAERIKASIQAEVASLKAMCGKAPRLTAVQIGENASSAVYVKAQKKTAEALGIEYELKIAQGDISQSEADKLIGDLNADDKVTAVILQLPLPKGDRCEEALQSDSA